ncbi:hypothetical protein [Catenulispora yoronensis]|uniref:hypothetical protein n=1 Tax=Catenulispora yoronensis TaxID=450799 RepID=UPI0031DBEF12
MLSFTVLALVAVVGFGLSIYFAQQNHVLSADIINKNNQIADLQKKQSTQTTPTPTTTPTTQPAPAATYLDIKEMGIKIKLSDDIKDAVYLYDTSYPATPMAKISSNTMLNKPGWCDLKNEPAFGLITERKSLAMPDGGTLKVDNTTVFQVGTNYFVYTSPQSPCAKNSDDQATEVSLLASFKQALTTMQADQ